MGTLRQIYGTSLALLTDLYEITMAYGYWKLGRHDHEAVFHLFFRKAPFGGGYAVAAGLAHVTDLLAGLRFDAGDLEYLASLKGNDARPLFEQGFLDYLERLEFACDVDAVREGTVIFRNEPLVRVCGPILQAQLIESVLLNIINFQSLVATKAARVCQAAGDDSVLEFGLRRAQGIDGSLAASRAAYIGGCGATSNVLAGKIYGIPVKGTHAHSWVMSFDDETESFKRYAEALPNNCVFLVDTNDTLAGVAKAIEVGKQLRKQGHAMVGIRLDSGDLAYLSGRARRMLDDAGFDKAVIVASNELDEQLIQNLKLQGAPIAIWGVGTKLVTAYDQPALGGVYKLAAVREQGAEWKHRIKLSEQVIKTTIPGMLQVRRFEDSEGLAADMIYDEITGVDDARLIVDPKDPTRFKRISRQAIARNLLEPVARRGRIVLAEEPLEQLRDRAAEELAKVHPGTRRFMNPHEYPVGLEPKLHELRKQMIAEARKATDQDSHA